MYGSLPEPHQSDPTQTATTSSPSLAQSRRLRYSKQELIRLRSTIKHSQSFNELQRIKIGPVSCSRAEQRWTARIGADGLFSCRDTKVFAVKPSPTSSPPFAVDERPTRRDSPPHEVYDLHQGASTPPESSSRSSMERDLAGIFQSSSENSLAARRSPSPTPKPSDQSDGLSTKTEGNAVQIPLSLQTKSGGIMASSPREETYCGVPEYRRRSPSPLGSPRAHPISSSRAVPASSSYPPGFGPQPAQRHNANKSSRNSTNNARDAYYKSRICRGPNISENFATRIAYRQRESCTSGGAVSGSAEGQARELGLYNSVGGFTSGLGTVKTQLGNYDNFEESSRRPKVGRPPTLCYNISSDISFEDFSRRLAAEAASNSVAEIEEHKERGETDSSAVEDAKMFAERAHGERDLKSDSSHQRDVDELKKWFGRMSASAELENDSEGKRMPESYDDHAESAPGIRFSGAQDSVDQLDSSVLSFFDTIRSQALLERNDVATENGEIDGRGTGGLGPMEDSRDYAHKEHTGSMTRTLESEGSKSSEVERFFQLFTEGKPVYSQAQSMSVENNAESSKRGYHENESSAVTSRIESLEHESDTGGLERWFAALAAGNRFE